MTDQDLDVIAPLAVEYYRWLSGHGGRAPQELLRERLTRTQRRLLLDRLDDVLVVWGITAPLREGPNRDSMRPKNARAHHADRGGFEQTP